MSCRPGLPVRPASLNLCAFINSREWSAPSSDVQIVDNSAGGDNTSMFTDQDDAPEGLTPVGGSCESSSYSLFSEFTHH